MAQSVYLLSLLFAVALVATVVFVSGRGWRDYSPPEQFRGGDGPSLAVRAAHDPAVWAVAFVTLVVGFGGGTVLLVSGDTSEAVKQGAGVFLVGATVVVLAAYLFYGTVISARGRGLKNSQAVALGSWMLGLAFIAAVTLKLLGAF